MLDLESIGFSRQELQDRVVTKMAANLLSGTPLDMGFDIDADEAAKCSSYTSSMRTDLQVFIHRVINDKVEEIAVREVVPKVGALVDGAVLQETNKYGEEKGQPKTFIEYIVDRADAYMMTLVDRDGNERDPKGYNSVKQTRLTFLISKHLQEDIETAMKEAMKVGISSVVKAIHETVRIQLNTIAANMKIQTNM